MWLYALASVLFDREHDISHIPHISLIHEDYQLGPKDTLLQELSGVPEYVEITALSVWRMEGSIFQWTQIIQHPFRMND